jgi:hypothetical protein
MYIVGEQANQEAHRAGTPPGGSTGLGADPTLGAAALQKAVTLNRVYARAVGWLHHTRQIAVLLGIRDLNPDIWSFVQALARWQARNGMIPNGVLGPGEWYTMQTPHRRP